MILFAESEGPDQTAHSQSLTGLHWAILENQMILFTESESPNQTAHPRSLIGTSLSIYSKTRFRMAQPMWVL